MNELPTVAPWRRRVARPLLLIGLISGAAIFLPRMMRHEVKLVPKPDDLRCVRYAGIALEQEGTLLRTVKLALGDDGAFTEHSVQLPAGSYLAHLSLHCESGDITAREPQPVVVDGEGTIYLRMTNRCDCGDG